MDIEELAVKITGDSQSLQGALSDAVGEMDIFGLKIGDMGKLLGLAGLAGFAKLAADKIGEMIDEFAEDETAQLKFNAAIESSNKLMPDAVEDLGDYAEEFAKLSGEAISATQDMVSGLLATGRTSDEIKTMTEAALGLANATGGSVDGILTQLNRTFSGSVGRLGTFVPDLAAQLKELSEDQLADGEAVDIIAGKYSSFAGVLKDSADVSIKNFENAWGEVNSAMGAVLNEGVQPLRDGLAEVFLAFASNKDAVVATLSAIAGGVLGIITAINPIAGLVSAATIALGLLGGAVLTDIGKAKKAADELMVSYAAMEEPWQKVARIKRETAERERIATEAQAKLVKEAHDKQVALQTDAETKHRTELEKTDTKVKLGILTEEKAADAKLRINETFINDLIDLKFTGATDSKLIGDKEIRDAITANDAIKADFVQKDLDKRAIAANALIIGQRLNSDWIEDAITTNDALALDAETKNAEILEAGSAMNVAERLAATATKDHAIAQIEAATVAAGLSYSEQLAADAAMEDQIKANATHKKEHVISAEQAAAGEAEKQALIASKAWDGSFKELLKSIESVAKTAFLDSMKQLGTDLGTGARGMAALGDALADLAGKIVDAMPQMLMQLAMTIMPVNPVAGIALIAASGLVAGVDAFMDTDAGKATGSAIVSGAKAAGNFLLGWTGAKFAEGTENTPSGVSLVGERGPELVRLPQGSQVKTNADTQSILAKAGGSNTFVFNSPRQLSPVDMKREFERTSRRLAFEGAF